VVCLLEVKKKDNESFESMIRRFTKKTIQSGKILQVKKIRFFSKPKSRRELKEGALRSKQINSRIEYMKKLGKFDELALKRNKKR